MDEQRMKEEEKQRQIEEEKKKVFRISKKPRPPEEITEQTDKSAKLSAQEKLERAKKLAASFGKAKTVVFSSKFDSNKSSAVSDKSSSEHKHDKPSHSEQKRKSGNDKHSNDKDVSRQTVKKPSNDKHSNDKDVPKQSDKKPSYKDNLEKMSDQEKLAIIKKISGSLGRVGDKISDTEKLDKIRKISETIGKGSSSNSDKNEKPNGYPKYSPLSSKIDRDKMTGNFESLQKIKKKFKEAEERVNGKTITMLGKTDEGIKREVIFDRTHAETMRYALQEKAAQIRAMINKPEKPKPRERKKGKNRASETEAKGKKSETSKNEDDEQRKYSDFKKSSSHSSDTKYNYKYSDDKSSDRSSREEKPVKKKKPPPPTSMNFNHNNDLLKIAEQKSQEPVKIEVIKKPKKEEERFLTKREMASQREYQEYFKNKKIRREAEIEEKQTVDVKREKQISNSLKSKSTSNLVTKSASSSQNTVRKNPYPEKLDTKSSSPVPSSSKLSSSSKLGKSMSSSSIPSKPFIKQFKLHSATNSQHNSDSNPAKKIKREHIEKERISQKGEHRKKSNGAKRSSHDDVRENVLVCGPPKNEKPVSSNPFDRIYGEIKKNQPTKPDSNPAKKIKREHTENERISQKDEHRKKSNGAKRSNYNDVRENVLVCGPPKNEKPVCSNPFDRMYGEIKKNQPTKPEPKPRERKKGKDRASETEAKGKKSETSKNEDDEERKYSDFKKSSSHSSDTKYNDKYSDDKSSDRSSREEKPVKKKKPPPPTSMNFNHNNDLLKIAEQKSQEHIKIEVTKKPQKGEERLLTKREMASQREYQEYLKNKKIRREAEIEERQTVDVKREKQISNSLKSKSTSNLVTKSASSSQNTVRKNPYSEKLVTKSSSPVPNSSKPSPSNKLGKSMSSSSIPSKPFTKQFKLHSATNSQHNSDSNPAKKIKREHREDERISQKDEHRKKSNGAKRSNYNDVRENVLVCGPPKNEKPVSSNPFDRMYGEIKKNQPTKPGSLDQIRQAVIVKTDNMATSNKRRATDTRGTIKGTKRSKGTNDLDQPTPPTSEIVLRIIAKTNMNNGYCYLGFDEEHERIFRPIFNTNTCCWPFEKDFCWKKSYRFLVTLNPDEDKVDFLTPYPHCNEDMVVTSIVKEEKTVPFNVQVLISVAKLDINDIYLDIKEEKYLFNNAQSPSVGILKCRSRNVSICSDDHSKDSRFKIHLPSGHYVFPMKGINIDEIPKVDREVLVVFGLGRPYTNRRSFHPARCYILVVGLFVV
ncbi:uncharacterized protein LOC127706962 isoform X2 [Mytilus californianus]|uniref:uncharacterized protein LOC127706962 isoform X2 n=1 Tax=Mytilus californianus TaxID=6549 RepID=UPI002247407A|nr:uncharacterized protein LOC127706962 isoform X2 [Mytilus californianus]